ncbi:MAG: transposase [Prevotella sp.]|nr:transposase [Prevotella sp.]MBR6997973.1 transposase [Prevotella sp.]
MADTLVKVDIHLIFHVKTTSVKIDKQDLERFHQYLGGTIRGLGSIPLAVGGMSDHVHILASLPKVIALSDFVRMIKSESSKWIKHLNELYRSFAWQEGYGAFSVSPSLSEKTVNYILHQEEHHQKRSFREEYKLFLNAYGIDYNELFSFCD